MLTLTYFYLDVVLSWIRLVHEFFNFDGCCLFLLLNFAKNLYSRCLCIFPHHEDIFLNNVQFLWFFLRFRQNRWGCCIKNKMMLGIILQLFLLWYSGSYFFVSLIPGIWIHRAKLLIVQKLFLLEWILIITKQEASFREWKKSSSKQKKYTYW